MLWSKIRTILRTYLNQRDWIFLKISASENHDSYFKVSQIPDGDVGDIGMFSACW